MTDGATPAMACCMAATMPAGSSGQSLAVLFGSAWFCSIVTLARSIEPILRGLAAQEANNVDTQVIDDVRNFLFGPPGSGGGGSIDGDPGFLVRFKDENSGGSSQVPSTSSSQIDASPG